MRLAGLGVIACLAAASPAHAQQPRLPVERSAYAPVSADYEAFVARARENFPGPFDEPAFRRDHPVADWETLRRGTGIEARSIAYRVDGLRITGIILRPRERASSRPVLIWARGGVGRAQLDEPQMVEMIWWIRRGYVVVASNYRGAGGSEGADEFGGRDGADLRALAEVVEGLQGADRSRVYAIGFSRGAMMLYRAVADGMPVRAFATAGGLTDLAALVRDRPDYEELFARMMPDHEQERSGGYCRRSASCWPARIGVPVLIAHGGDDPVVPPSQAWSFARALEQADRRYQLVIYGAAGHGLDGWRRDLFERAHALFQRAP